MQGDNVEMKINEDFLKVGTILSHPRGDRIVIGFKNPVDNFSRFGQKMTNSEKRLPQGVPEGDLSSVWCKCLKCIMFSSKVTSFLEKVTSPAPIVHEPIYCFFSKKSIFNFSFQILVLGVTFTIITLKTST